MGKATELFKAVLGLLVMIGAVYGAVQFSLWDETWLMIKGSIAPFVFLIGLLIFFLGVSELKE